MRPALLRPLAALAAILGSLVLVPATPAVAGKGAADQLAAAQRRANEAARRYSLAQTALARTENEIATLEARLSQTDAVLSKLEQTVREFAVHRYVNGAASSDNLLVTHGDLAEASRAQTMAEFVLLGRAQAIDGYRTARADLADTRAALDRKKAEQRAASRALRARQAEAEAEVRRLAALERQRQARERAAATARRRSSSRVVGVIASGNWICPVQGPHAFSNDWGQPRSGGRRHQGNDIFAPYGTPTVAPVGGRVTHRTVTRGGLSWYVYGDDGNTYFGTHLSGYAGGDGHVAAGTVIGYVGTSGNAAGSSPHLHFEIHPGGGPAVNPYFTLVKYC